MSPEAAEAALRKIYRRAARAQYSEMRMDDMRKTRQQLAALEKALSGLGLRAEEALTAALESGPLDDFMPHPYRKVRVLIDNPTQLDSPAWKMSGPLLLLMLKRASARATVEIQKLPTSPSVLSDATRQAVRNLVDLFCADDRRPRPYPSRENPGAVKHNDALVFAYQCLAAWGDPDMLEVSADELCWCVYSN